MTGNYKITITYSDTSDCYIAEGTTPDREGIMITSGQSAEELFNNISDAYLTLYGVNISWWNKLLNKLRR